MHYFTEIGENGIELENLEKATLAVKSLSAKYISSSVLVETKDKVVILTLWPDKLVTQITSNFNDLDANGLCLTQPLTYG